MSTSSILTNLSAMSAVQNLASTQQQLSQVQNEISTGLAISSAQDNAAYWSISQTMRTNVSNLSAVTSSLNLGSSVLSTATSATNNIYSVLQSISKNLVSAAQPGTDLGALQTSINTLRQQLASTVSTASFNGVNMLDGSNGNSVSFVAGVTGSGAGTTINTISISTAETNLGGSNYVVGSNALAKAATTADSALAAGQAANATALSNLTTDVSTLTSTDLAAGAGDAAVQAIFGSGATVSVSSGVATITGIGGSGTGAAFLGTGSNATISINTTSKAITAYSNGASASGGTLTALYGSSATQTTTSSTAAGSLSAASANADAAALADPAAQTAYLVDTAAAAVNANAAAQTAYTTAQSNFTTAVAGLTATDYTSDSSAFKAVFGNNAAYNSGTITGMTTGSTAAALMGTGGTYTVATGSYSTAGTSAATGGALYTVYGSSGTDQTTPSTATGGTALAAKNAVAAVNNNSAASTIFNGGLFAISQINLAGASSAQIQAYASQVGAALQSVTNAQEVLGAASSNITLQTTYTSNLSDSLTSGVGSLVDADMNEASTRLSALQTQQQLGVQSLSVANQNSQLILKLFGG